MREMVISTIGDLKFSSGNLPPCLGSQNIGYSHCFGGSSSNASSVGLWAIHSLTCFQAKTSIRSSLPMEISVSGNMGGLGGCQVRKMSRHPQVYTWQHLEVRCLEVPKFILIFVKLDSKVFHTGASSCQPWKSLKYRIELSNNLFVSCWNMGT